MTNDVAGGATRRWWFAYAAILSLAIAVRWVGLSDWDVWTDELHTMQIARTGEYSFGPAYRTAPLNFMLTSWAMRAFGDAVVVARAIPFAAGVVTVALFMLVAARWVGRRPALLGGLLLALSSWHVYWSQNARHFALTTCFVLVGLHGFLAYWKERKWWGALLAPVALLAGLFTHSSAGFYLAALMTFVGCSLLLALWKPALGLPPVRHHLLALSSLLVALVIYLPAYLSVGEYLLANVAPWNPAWNIVGSLVFYVTPVLGFFALSGFAVLTREGDPLGWILLATLIVPLGLLTFASNFTTASAAYYLPSLVSIALLGGVAADRVLSNAAPRLAASALVVGGLFAGLGLDLTLYHTYYRGLKPRWADATAYLRENRRPGDIILAAEADVVAHYLGSRTDVVWMDLHATALDSPAVPRHPGGGTWYAVYASEGSLLALPEAAQEYLGEHATMKQVFPMSYGPKDRLLAVFYEPPGGAP